MSSTGYVRQESALEVCDYLIDSNVWVKSGNEQLFTLGVVKSIDNNTLLVEVDGISSNYPVSECLNALYGYSNTEVEDLVRIPHSNSAIVLNLLRDRFYKDSIYTYVGKILVALNPFKQIDGLYDVVQVNKYRNSDVSRGWPTDLPPHSFAVAQAALYGLRNTGISQSCIVSGESGAGKTETAKQIMNYLSCTNNNINIKNPPLSTTNTNDVQSLILGSMPLFESLGNAKTIRNNNSSRFGRFIMLDVGDNGGLKGCRITSYMLELIRIEFQSTGERNYHIFYQIIKYFSNNPKKMELFGLKNMEYYNFLNSSNCYKIDNVDDEKEFIPVKSQLETMFKNDVEYFYKALSAVLLAGNITFVEEDGLNISNIDEFKKLCELLGIEYNVFSKSIVSRKVIVNNEVIISPSTKLQAITAIRTIAKDVYNKLFNLCVDTLNNSIQFDLNNPWIGILDIYGFEFFKRNTFEQLLINYANERLQQHFIHQSFKSQVNEYELEGIDYSMITFSDNSNVISVFDKPNLGIFSFLQEQCLIQTGSPSSFTSTCNKHIKDNSYIPGKGSQLKFSIKHTVATVEYQTDDFVDKNRHKVSVDSLELLMKSTNPIIKKAFESVNVKEKGKFVASMFHSSMEQLMKTLVLTKSHFIRCIKSNEDKVPNKFDTSLVLNQLVSLSIFDSIQSVHKGFVISDTFDEFYKKNKMLIKIDDKLDKIEGIKSFLHSINVDECDYRIGKTKVFLRKSAWLALDAMYRKVAKMAKPLAVYFMNYYKSYKLVQRINSIEVYIIRIQSLYRKEVYMRSKKHYIDMCDTFIGTVITLSFLNYDLICNNSAIIIQSLWRGYLVRKSLKMKKFGAVLLLTSKLPIFKRNIRDRLQNKAAIMIQANWRRFISRRIWLNDKQALILDKSVRVIQKNVKSYLYKKAFSVIKLLTPHVICIQANWRGYMARKAYDLYMFRTKLKKLQAQWFIKRIVKTILVCTYVGDLKQSLKILQRVIFTQGIKLLFVDMYKATIFIQSVHRGNIVRNKYSQQIRSRVISNIREKNSKYLHAENVSSKDFRNRVSVLWCGNEFKNVYLSGWTRFMEDAQLVACGKFHTIIYKHPDVYALGINSVFLGVDARIASVPHRIFTLSPLLKVNSISCGEYHTLVLLSNGLVLGWGDNKYSQVYGSNTIVSKPVLIPFFNPIISISCGRYHNAVIDMVGNVYIWGKGSYLGLKSNISIPTLLSNYNNILGCNYSRGDVNKVLVGDEIIYILDSMNSLHSISKFGHYDIMDKVNNVWTYHKSAIVLSEDKLYHVNHRNIIEKSMFLTVFQSLNSINDVYIGYHEIVVNINGKLLVIKEDYDNNDTLTNCVDNISSKNIYTVSSSTISALIVNKT